MFCNHGRLGKLPSLFRPLLWFIKIKSVLRDIYEQTNNFLNTYCILFIIYQSFILLFTLSFILWSIELNFLIHLKIYLISQDVRYTPKPTPKCENCFKLICSIQLFILAALGDDVSNDMVSFDAIWSGSKEVQNFNPQKKTRDRCRKTFFYSRIPSSRC